MINSLTAILPIINDNSVACGIEAFLLGNLGDGHHQVSEHGLMRLIGQGQLRETLAVFWDHQEMHFGDWVHVSEGQAAVVLVNNGGWNLLADDLVKDGYLFWCCGLCFFLLVHL